MAALVSSTNLIIRTIITIKDSYWIVGSFLTARSMMTTLLFALTINFVLKIESNVWEVLRILSLYF